MKNSIYKRCNNLLLALGLILFFRIELKAQITSYSFTKSNGVYTPIAGGTTLGTNPFMGLLFGDPSNLNGTSTWTKQPGFPIGFNFAFDGSVYDRFVVCSNGWIQLGHAADSIQLCSAPNQTKPIFNSANSSRNSNCGEATLCALGNKLSGNSTLLRFQLLGSAPNRKLIVQWKNFGVFPDIGNGNEYFTVNFQIILYESSNIIQFVYGDVHPAIFTNASTYNIEVGIKGYTYSNYLLCQSTQSWDSLNLVNSTPASITLSDSCMPSIGLTYTFTPGPSCTLNPTAGKAIASLYYVCPNDIDTISLSGNNYSAGFTFRWESSPDANSWTTIPGKVNRFFATKISATKYFRCIVQCANGIIDTSDFVKVTLKQNYLCQYCQTTYGGACNLYYSSVFDDVKIVGTTFHYKTPGQYCPYGNINSKGTTYDPSDSLTANLFQGQTYTMSITSAYKAYYLGMWVDYNQDSYFSDSEFFRLLDTISANVPTNAQFTVPALANSGMVEARFTWSNSEFNFINPSSSCGPNGFSTGDFIFFVGSQLPCTSPPVGGIAVPSLNYICSTDNPIITLIGNSTGADLTYKWEKSYDGINWLNTYVTFSNLLTALFNDTVYYRCQLTCNGSTATSSVAVVYGKPVNQCYCATSIGGSNCAVNDQITNVEILGTGLNNSDTLCNYYLWSNLHSFQPDIGTCAILNRGSTYTLNVTTNKSNRNISAWIDYNQNGVFNSYEHIPVSANSTAYAPISTTFVVPPTASIGPTGLRIRTNLASASNSNLNSCTNFSYGESEQYLVSVDFASNMTENFETGTVLINPNPVQELLNVSMEAVKQNSIEINLINNLGQPVYLSKFKIQDAHFKTAIDVSEFKRGIYMLKIISNNRVQTKKVILN